MLLNDGLPEIIELLTVIHPNALGLLLSSSMLVQVSLMFLLMILLALVGNRWYKEYRLRNKYERDCDANDLYIKEVLKEKEWLLREINHRVKNNLQVMISLLNSQEFFLKAPEALEAIKNSQRRLHAISLAYQKVYEPVNPADIDMNVYITELIDYLKDEYKSGEGITCDLHISRIYLPITSAVPIGLIINEAISNAFQYAFPQQTNGKVEIQFVSGLKEGSYKLSIADNGIGMPSSYKSEEIRSLGTSLMMGLSRQLRGELEMKNDQGVSITVEFTNLKSEIEYQS